MKVPSIKMPALWKTTLVSVFLVSIHTAPTVFALEVPPSTSVDSIAAHEKNTKDSDVSLSVAKKAHQSSLRQEGDVFGIPLFINDDTDLEVLKITRETFIRLLDTSNNGKPDDPELIEFMVKNNSRVIVLHSLEDFDDLEDDSGADDFIARVTSSETTIETFVTALLELITVVRIELLMEKTRSGDRKSLEDAIQLNDAIEQVYTSGVIKRPGTVYTSSGVIERQGTESDNGASHAYEPVLPAPVIVLIAQNSLNGQGKAWVRRTLHKHNAAKKAKAIARGETFKPSTESDLGFLVNFYSIPLESLQQKIPLIFDWIKSHNYSLPYIDIDALRPVREGSR